MAQIDVSSLLVDPDFVDRIVNIRRTPAINSLGENTVSEMKIDTWGSVQPASGRAVQRLPEALRVANVSSFWFKGEIVASGPGEYTSVLAFRGRRYQVQYVFDWTNWGEGWCEGTCIAELPS